MPSKDIISGAIALYMPPDIKVSYGAGWGAGDMGISGDIAEAYKSIKDKDLGFMDAVKEARQHGSGIVMQKGKEYVSAITSGAGMGDWVKLMGKGMGLAINNHAEMLYEGPHFREFTYSFRFWPRNPDETEKVKDIIKMFKYHMHPGKNKNAWHKGRMFDYPSEFEIHYLHNTGIIDSLNKIRGLNCLKPSGAFYVFPSCKKLLGKKSKIKTDTEFVEKLLEKSNVAVVQGSAFGLDGYFRISYATSMHNLKKAMDRIKSFCESLN